MHLRVKVTQNFAQYSLHHVTYLSAKIEVAASKNYRGEAFFKENIFFDLLTHRKCWQVPSTSCDLCTCKVWSCCVQCFRWRCIYKKIHNLTLTLTCQGHTKCLPVSSTSCDSLKLLGPTVKKIQIQETRQTDGQTYGQTTEKNGYNYL